MGGIRGIIRKRQEIVRKHQGMTRKFQGMIRKLQGITRKHQGMTRKFQGMIGKLQEIVRKLQGITRKLRQEIIRNRWRLAILLCAALGWWGAIYPQFTMVKGTCRIVYEDPEDREGAGAEKGGSDLYWELMRAERGQIRFRSRLFTELGALRKYLQGSFDDSEGEY